MQIKLDKNQLSHIRHTLHSISCWQMKGKMWSIKTYYIKSMDEHSKGRPSRGCRKSFDGGGSDLHKYAKSGNLGEIERCLGRYSPSAGAPQWPSWSQAGSATSSHGASTSSTTSSTPQGSRSGGWGPRCTSTSNTTAAVIRMLTTRLNRMAVSMLVHSQRISKGVRFEGKECDLKWDIYYHTLQYQSTVKIFLFYFHFSPQSWCQYQLWPKISSEDIIGNPIIW